MVGTSSSACPGNISSLPVGVARRAGVDFHRRGPVLYMGAGRSVSWVSRSPWQAARLATRNVHGQDQLRHLPLPHVCPKAPAATARSPSNGTLAKVLPL